MKLKHLCGSLIIVLLSVSASAQTWLSRAAWSCAADSSYSSSYLPAKAIDANSATQWQSSTGAAPHYLSCNFGSSQSFNALQYTFRNDAYSDSHLKTYEVYVSSDGSTWGTAVASGTLPCERRGVSAIIRFASQTAQYVKLVSTTAAYGADCTGTTNSVGVAELNVGTAPTEGHVQSIVAVGASASLPGPAAVGDDILVSAAWYSRSCESATVSDGLSTGYTRIAAYDDTDATHLACIAVFRGKVTTAGVLTATVVPPSLSSAVTVGISGFLSLPPYLTSGTTFLANTAATITTDALAVSPPTSTLYAIAFAAGGSTSTATVQSPFVLGDTAANNTTMGTGYQAVSSSGSYTASFTVSSPDTAHNSHLFLVAFGVGRRVRVIVNNN